MAAIDMLQKLYRAKMDILEEEQRREPYHLVRERAILRSHDRRSFLGALRAASGAAVIAEIKHASPSKGLIVKNLELSTIALAYEKAGAEAISVVTERAHFLGDLSYLDRVRLVTSRPLLRKDFLWTRYHMAQSAAHGADCVLLIMGGMDDVALHECIEEAQEYALDTLLEVHNDVELGRAIRAGAELIGVNNRDLNSFVTNLDVSKRLLPNIPTRILAVSESGILNCSDVAALYAAGAGALLIGEALMRAEDPAAFIKSLRSNGAPHVR